MPSTNVASLVPGSINNERPPSRISTFAAYLWGTKSPIQDQENSFEENTEEARQLANEAAKERLRLRLLKRQEDRTHMLTIRRIILVAFCIATGVIVFSCVAAISGTIYITHSQSVDRDAAFHTIAPIFMVALAAVAFIALAVVTCLSCYHM